jgi:hypothetical protein
MPLAIHANFVHIHRTNLEFQFNLELNDEKEKTAAQPRLHASIVPHTNGPHMNDTHMNDRSTLFYIVHSRKEYHRAFLHYDIFKHFLAIISHKS